ncbi:PLP-dependent transferase [Eremomyces bilateralis CBS 781.70]|uniref:PLP-dependent transferase n=1 Tax=Eremomyces bilateralis CBS 781.70 TaxID=1392243 RepID=A0A6G1FXE3_9PEZI|nr:PLP-dependent transferase [Eremomyces bilateralis CBS 781.70]KAF1810418.1 PLP-dependent transferase [Eremomyces bilateralis CBS 781.70]
MSEAILSQRGSALAKRFEKSHLGAVLKVARNPYDEGNEDGYINFGISDNYAMQGEMTKYINEHIHIEKLSLTYGEAPWGPRRLRAAMAKHMTTYFQPIEPIDPDGIICVNGVTSLVEMLAWILADPGDGILLPRPIYQAFIDDFGLKGGCRPVLVGFQGRDQFAPDAARAYEEAIVEAREKGVAVKVFILCNPHNPLGRCYPRETVIELMKVCARHKIHIISDEIYALSKYQSTDSNAVPFESVLSWDFSPYIDKDYVHVAYGMSKDLASSGLRLGTLYTTNRPLLAALQGISRFHSASSLAITASTLILEDEAYVARFAAKVQTTLSECVRIAAETFTREGIPFADGTSAGFFLWVDMRQFLPKDVDGWEGEKQLAARMVEKKVYMTPGAQLSSEEPGWFRIIFSHERKTLVEGLRRVILAVRAGT